MQNEDTVRFFTPSLVATLLRVEREIGSPLSEAQVLQVLDQAVYIEIPSGLLPAMIEERGYEDIDPDHCWEQWQEARIALVYDD